MKIGHKTLLSLLISATSMAGIFYSLAFSKQPESTHNGFVARRIAHAGGGYNKLNYTNSLQALDSNYKKGHRYFEIDFSFTKDGKLICLHDWDHSFLWAYHYSVDDRLTLKEFEAIAGKKPEYTKCSINSLAKWMKSHPQAVIVTDLKEGTHDRKKNQLALNQMIEVLPDAKNRVIPQIYHPASYTDVKHMGFRQIILTLYPLYHMKNDEIVSFSKNFDGPVAIAMPSYRAKSNLPRRLRELGIPTYVHTINSMEEVKEYKKRFCITEVYTDFLPATE